MRVGIRRTIVGLSRAALLTVIAGGVIPGAPCAPGALAAQSTIDISGADRALELRLEPLFEVGGLGGAPWDEFQELSAAAFAPGGRLLLLDGPSDVLLAVDSRGELVRRYGRGGQGPGEFGGGDGVLALPDGRVGVWSDAKRAFVMFDSAGAVLDEIRLSDAAGVPGGPFALAGDGRVVTFPEHLITGRLGHVYATGDGFIPTDAGLPLLVFPLAAGATVREVVRAPMPVSPPGTGARRAFEPFPSFGLLDGGAVALQHSQEYRIDILRADGSIQRTLSRAIPARPVTDRDRRAYDESMRDVTVRSLGQPGAPGRPVTEIPVSYHPVVPPVLRIVTDGRRHIWVQRRHTEDPTREGAIDVLGADGTYVGTFAAGVLPGLPAAFGPDGTVVFLAEGELDVPVARVYRLPEALR